MSAVKPATLGATVIPATPASATEGLDAARPAASAATIGQTYWATDTLVQYAQINATDWIVVDTELTTASIGTFGIGAYVVTAAAPSAEPQGGPGQSFACLFYATGNPAATGVVAAKQNGLGTNGWYLACGRNVLLPGEMEVFSFGLNGGGVGGTLPLVGADFTGAVGLHCVAFTMTAGAVPRWSFDGGVVQSVAALPGAYVPPIAGDLMSYGATVAGAFPMPEVELTAFKCWSTVLSDADLQAVSGAFASGRLPNGTGTVTLDVNMNRHVSGTARFREYRGAAAALWTVNGALEIRAR